MKMFHVIKMKRFLRRIGTYSSTSHCENYRDRAIVAPFLSKFVLCTTNVHGSRRWRLDAAIQNCSSNILRGVLARHYCTSQDDDFPRLTRLKCRGYPTTFASISNFFLTYLVIKPHLDQSFSATEFLNTSKKVVEMVSNQMAEADLEALKDLVTTDVFDEIKTNLPKFSASQRQDLAFSNEELVYSFLDTISLNVDNENNTKSLEILTIHHAIKGIEELKKLAENLNPFEIQTFQKKILESKPRSFVLNYRFLRKFSNTGEADDWILNGVQHQSGKSMKMMNFL